MPAAPVVVASAAVQSAVPPPAPKAEPTIAHPPHTSS
jgi:hypothetical protein